MGEGGSDLQITGKVKAASLGSFSLPTPMPQWNGLLIKRPGASPIWQIDRGVRRGFTRLEHFQRIIRPEAEVHEVLDVNAIPDGGIYEEDLNLISADGIAGVYLMDRGRKRPITAAVLMDLYSFDWNKIVRIPLGALVAIPDGPHIEPRR